MIGKEMRNLTCILFLAAGIFGSSVATFAGGAGQERESQSAGIFLVAPEDGGTPRDAGRIVAAGQGEFRIRARAEEGRSVLTHAVSRVDLICRNRSEKPQDVTLHLDLSDDGRRTNADNNTFGGMSTRDFLFIQPPGRPWQQINGSVAGWICTVRFSAPLGETNTSNVSAAAIRNSSTVTACTFCPSAATTVIVSPGIRTSNVDMAEPLMKRKRTRSPGRKRPVQLPFGVRPFVRYV